MFKHNQKVICEIKGTKITDARISIDSSGIPYICQNQVDGNDAENKLGYKYSWVLGGDFTDLSGRVTNLRSATKSFDNPQEGDEYKELTGGSKWVLGVCGRAIMLSAKDEKDICEGTYTKEELIKFCFTIVQDKSEPKEIIEVDGNKYKLIK